jgi:Periplasmic binding protein-like domain
LDLLHLRAPETSDCRRVLQRHDIGVLRESYQQSVHLPNDLSVVGFDDILLAQFVIPPLTTVKMSQTEIARWAFNALLADVQRTTVAPNGTGYQLRTNLVLRNSTAMAPSTSQTASEENRASNSAASRRQRARPQ